MPDEMASPTLSRVSSRQQRHSVDAPPLYGIARHTFGLVLLLFVVFLWTLSNFLGSSIFADNTYAKPFFLTYLDTSAFMLVMVPTLLRTAYQRHRGGTLKSVLHRNLYKTHHKGTDEAESMLHHEDLPPSMPQDAVHLSNVHLGLRSTARLSLTFCLLWFCANYFAMACLQYTTVASATILTSTSSIWTLLIGACTHTEKFTWRKLLGVLASFVGILLVSRVDLSSRQPTQNPHQTRTPINPFPDKPASELALGDILALFSAVIYGLYTITLKRSTLHAQPQQLDMPLFFGLVGFFNFIFLWPLFPILHITGLEHFHLPPTSRIWTVLLINCVSSLLSDICWAYAMLLTSPLVVTVGLSLTIPLSLVGEMVIQGRAEGALYWVGAMVVVGSFVFVDREEVKDECVHDTIADNEGENIRDNGVVDGGDGDEQPG